MRRIRVIPTLLLNSDGGLVKTVKFGKRTYIGDPINAVKIFNEKEVDELVILDIDATTSGRAPNYALIEDIASEAFMPVAYGGGIRSVDQIAALFHCGVEKIILSTAVYESPEIIREAVIRFGSQSIVACLNIRTNLFGKKQVCVRGGSINLKQTPSNVAQMVEELGVGEILVYSIARDGTCSGYDISMLKTVSMSVNIPVIACGGARNTEDFYHVVTKAGCSAVAAGSMFVFQGTQRGVLISYPEKSELKSKVFSRI